MYNIPLPGNLLYTVFWAAQGCWQLSSRKVRISCRRPIDITRTSIRIDPRPNNPFGFRKIASIKTFRNSVLSGRCIQSIERGKHHNVKIFNITKSLWKHNKVMFNLFCVHYRCTAVACFPSFNKFTNTFDSHECVAHFVVFEERKFGLCLRSSELFILYIRVEDNELKD